jgi:eukaryotic-like serine/threonine-protein kinase
MSIIGKTLGNFEITSQLGKGGMGEVYQAKDQKLGRSVAIKVLPDEFARDADRVARFQREAKVLASLNHPNIASIYGLEESGGTNFLVLELVEGETLADQIKRGPIPAEDSLKRALQITEALEAAHEKEIVHRDLKPANIKVTPEGKVKVLDFGLAKAFAGDKEEVNLSNSPTLSDAATQQGVILGTAAYMSPEQARGKAVDKRSDIWAFGCVLFEMLAGRAAFAGQDVTEILAAVIRAEPEWTNLPANLHWRLREVLERCLKKDARDRYHDISDVRADIQRVLADPSGILTQPIITANLRGKSRSILWISAAVVLTAIIVGVAIWQLKPSEPRQVVYFEYELPEGQQITGLAVSPDGKQFIYSTGKGIYLRALGEPAPKLIPGIEEDCRELFYSPDGKWIGYYSEADKKLKKVSINGGAPSELCDAKNILGVSWGINNKILFGTFQNGIMQVSASGGTPEVLIKPKSGAAGFPQLLPDGKSVLYSNAPSIINLNQSKIMIQLLQSGETKELCSGIGARYIPTGHIVYYSVSRNSISVLSVPFDLDKHELKGEPVPAMPGSMIGAISDSGTAIYVTVSQAISTGIPPTTLVWVDRQGKEEPLGAPSNPYIFPRISPDGTRIALGMSGENPDIWVWDLVRKTMTRLTLDKGIDNQPIWTPDSKQILFFSNRENKFGGIFRKQADGTGDDEKIIGAPDRQLYPWAMSSDGKTLVVVDTPDSFTAKADISVISMEGDHALKPLLHRDEYFESQAKISPNGKYIAYVSNESGKLDVIVRPFPEANKGWWIVSPSGGSAPLWSPNGRELFYFSLDDGGVMAVPVETEKAFTFGTPTKLFSRTPYLGEIGTPGTAWDIHPNGKRFLMMKRPGATPSEPLRKITVVVNWFEELKQRMAAK